MTGWDRVKSEEWDTECEGIGIDGNPECVCLFFLFQLMRQRNISYAYQRKGPYPYCCRIMFQSHSCERAINEIRTDFGYSELCNCKYYILS